MCGFFFIDYSIFFFHKAFSVAVSGNQSREDQWTLGLCSHLLCPAIFFFFPVGLFMWETAGFVLQKKRGLSSENTEQLQLMSKSSSSSFLVKVVKELIRQALSSLTIGLISVRCSSYKLGPVCFNMSAFGVEKEWAGHLSTFKGKDVCLCCRPGWHDPLDEHLEWIGWFAKGDKHKHIGINLFALCSPTSRCY